MVHKRNLGQRYPFHERPWAEVRDFVGAVAANNPSFSYLVDIADSVLTSGADTILAGSTAMHDILVVPRPIPEPPYEVIAVRAPNSLRPPSQGHILIEHLSLTGRDDRIEREPAEAVPLFWRFIREKYGLTPPISCHEH